MHSADIGTMTNPRQEKTEAALKELREAVEAYGGPTKLAADIQTSRSHITNVMYGTRDLGRETAAKLRTALKVRPSVLLDLLLDFERGSGPQA